MHQLRHLCFEPEHADLARGLPDRDDGRTRLFGNFDFRAASGLSCTNVTGLEIMHGLLADGQGYRFPLRIDL